MLSLLLCFGFSVIPMMYLFSYLFDIPSAGFAKMSLINVFTVIVGVGGFLMVTILQNPGLDLEHVGNKLHWLFLLVPLYDLSTGIRDMHLLYTTHKLCDTMLQKCIIVHNLTKFTPEQCQEYICTKQPKCCNTTSDYYDWTAPGIGKNIFFSIMVGIVLIAILLLNEYRIFIKLYEYIFFSKTEIPSTRISVEDDDVRAEKLKIRNFEMDAVVDYNLVLSDVTKYYKNFMAVNKLCLAVQSYECFGLLGVNGAGKTTTFKMCTGDIQISSGDIWVNGLNLKTNIKRIYQLIGYCPQFDALLDDLTCYETIIIFSLLRGYTKKDCQLMAVQLSHEYDFFKHLHKEVKQLSGGNKRKLSTAVAMIGDPIILYLDEPTTGMDPATKRYLWNAICKIRDQGTSIILTSHSMEECEALCTRLAIMVNGVFMCLGSTQHLKNKYSQGYTLIIRVKKTYNAENDILQYSETKSIQIFIEKQFNDIKLLEQYQDLLTFHIGDPGLPWSKMFGIMEKAKYSLNIEDYSLAQSSLEQVFLAFTKQQKEEHMSTISIDTILSGAID